VTTEVKGTEGNDVIVLPEDGAVIHGRGGIDCIVCDTTWHIDGVGQLDFNPPLQGGHLSASDVIAGSGNAITFVILNGKYNLDFTPTTMTQVQHLLLDWNNVAPSHTGAVHARHSYNLVLDDATNKSFLFIDGHEAGAVSVDARAETAASLAVYGGFGHNKLIGGDGHDSLSLWHGDGRLHGRGGDDTLRVGLAGDDYMSFGEGDITGGRGERDLLVLSQVKFNMLQFDAASTGIEVLAADVSRGFGTRADPKILGDGRDNDFDLSGFGVYPTKKAMTIDGLEGNDTLTGWSFRNALDGGDGNDVLIGGSREDVLIGGDGQDWMSGGADADVFVFRSAGESTGAAIDTINGFDFADDAFDVTGTVTSVSEIEGGRLDGDRFDSLLRKAVVAHLDAHAAVLWTPEVGDLAHETFLVIDQNGRAGYQPGEDLVLHLEDALNIAAFGVDDFI
jgi:Ca2+-binding RTX toxin-like protein